jgi:hypothetical protein
VLYSGEKICVSAAFHIPVKRGPSGVAADGAVSQETYDDLLGKAPGEKQRHDHWQPFHYV